MHSHVSHLQMHFVDTMHSEAYTFTYICTHSDAFDTVRILTHSYTYRSFPLLPHSAHHDAFLALSPLGFSCECMCGPRIRRMCAYFHAFWCMRMHSYAFLCILKPSWSKYDAIIAPRMAASKSGIVPPSRTGIQIYALKCIIVGMH
jgi:hypothetical protein